MLSPAVSYTTVWFFGTPGANFDLASLSFQLPICGSSAKQKAAPKKQSARVSPVVFVFISSTELGFLSLVNISFSLGDRSRHFGLFISLCHCRVESKNGRI